MRPTTLALLLALSGPAVLERGLPIDLVLALPIGATPPAKRGLLHYLSGRGDIWIEQHGDTQRVLLSKTGLQSLRMQLPQFDQAESQIGSFWTTVILKTAPKRDRQFRYLSKLLGQRRCYRLTRAVYLYPGPLPFKVRDTIDRLYSEREVAVATVGEWQSGLNRADIVSFYELEALSEIYSGISKEIDGLLASNREKLALKNQSISALISCIARFSSAVADDCGLLPTYFPSVPSSAELLDRFGDAFSRLAEI